MGKLSSGRVKRTPQTGITSDRYEFLGLRQAEPNLGDPLVGPSSIGANPIPVGSYYQLAAIGEKVGERYWTTPVGIGTTIGIISVYDNGFLPNNAFQKIHGLNFVGAGVTVEVPSIEFIGDVGIATIRIAVRDIFNSGDVGQILFNTPAGIVGGASNFYYNSTSNNVGVGSTLPSEDFDVNGIIKTQDIKIEGTLIVQGSPGLNGQYLKSTASGLEWEYIPQTLRVGFTTIASVNQSVFEFNYNPDIIDVFSNGVRLNQNEVVAENGTTITFNNPCFGGELIDIITYEYLNISNIVFGGGEESYWKKTSVGIHTLSNVGIGTTNPTSALTVSGTIQATAFTGNGSGLTGLFGIGSGVEIQENESLIGTASTINFRSNIDVSFSDGVATIDVTAGIATYASTAGIATNVIGGIASVTSLNVTGISTFNNIVGTALSISGISTIANFRITNVGTGATVGGIGVVTYYGDGSGLTKISSSSLVGIVTYADRAGIATNVIGGIGSITQLQVTGVSTFTNGSVLVGSATSTGTASQRLQVTGGTYISDNLGIGTTNPTSKLHVVGDVKVIGVVTATRFESETTDTPVIDATDTLSINTPKVSISTDLTVGGNVGIGTTNPTSKLHVIGDVKIGINTSQGVVLTSPDGTKYRLFVNNSGILSTSLVP